MNQKKKSPLFSHEPTDPTPPDILESAKNGSLSGVEKAVKSQPASLNKQDEAGLTALHWAAGNRNLAICTFLISQPGIDPWIEDCRSRKAIDHALDTGSEKIIKLIMDFMYRETMED